MSVGFGDGRPGKVWVAGCLALLLGCGGGGGEGGNAADAGGGGAGMATGGAAGSPTGGMTGTGGMPGSSGGSGGRGGTGGGGSGGGTGGGGGSGGAAGTGGSAGSGGAAGTGGSGGSSGAGGSAGTGGMVMGPPSGDGDHSCLVEVSPVAGWVFGVQSTCTTYYATMPPLTADQKKLLDGSCTGMTGGKVVPSCPRADAVGYCDVLTGAMPLKGYRFINKSAVTPDTDAFSVNGFAICSAAAGHDTSGRILNAKCTGTVTAKVDGVMVDFSKMMICWYKSDGTKAEYYVNASDTMGSSPTTKSFSFAVHDEGGKQTFVGSALAPGIGYVDGFKTFPFPKDMGASTLQVTKFAAKGAGLAARGDRRAAADATRSVG